MMRPIELAPLEVTPLLEQRPKGRKTRLPAPMVDWRAEIAGDAYERVGRIAEAVRAVSSEWHTLFLALGGALLSRGLPPGELPAFLRAVSHAAGDTRTQDRELAARTTVQRRLGGLSVAGLRQLREKWPAVADALEEAFAPKPVQAPMGLNDATTASAELVEVFRKAPDGLTIISAECGLGKTRAAQIVALERARSAAGKPDQRRAPPRTKTAISVDKNRLAVQIAEELRSQGVAVRRLFGPLSLKNEAGEHECKYHDIASHLVRGRQSMQWELCEGRGKEPCRYHDTCKAVGGAEGPTDARISVGPHQLVGELDASAGTTGILVIDEPPHLLETESLSAEQFERALVSMNAFGRRYASALRPALRALRGYLSAEAEIDEVCSAADAVRHGSEHVDPLELSRAIDETGSVDSGDVGEMVLQCIRAAQYPDHKSSSPPIQPFFLERAKTSAAYAEELGSVSRILWLVHRALTAETPVSVRVEEKRDERIMFITCAREDLVRALQREGSVIVADANALIYAPILCKTVGYEAPVHHFAASDGAAVQRTHIRTFGATRRSWISHGRLSLKSVVSALRAAVDWVVVDPTMPNVGIITVKILELAIEMTLRPDAPALKEEWTRLGQRGADAVRKEFEPILKRLPSAPLLGHYGAVRGLNSMADVDVLITLGDPWTDLGQARNDGYFLGLGERWRERYEALARAELEQAHGRLRAIHRTRRARALHVGGLLPSGSGWSHDVETRVLARGRPVNAAAMKPDEAARLVAALGGISRAAKLLGCNRMTVSRYVSGLRAVSQAEAEELRSLAIEVSVADSRTIMVGDATEMPRIERDLIKDFRLHANEITQHHSAIGVSVASSDEDDDPPDGGGGIGNSGSVFHRSSGNGAGESRLFEEPVEATEDIRNVAQSLTARGPLARFREAA